MPGHNRDIIEWYRPDPRAIIPLNSFHVSRSLSKILRKGIFTVTRDQDFEGVMRGCAVREEGTWITEEFIRVYGEMHRQGIAHSVEVWQNDRLVGGTYGINIGSAFMAESMFHHATNASKVAVAALVDHLNKQHFTLFEVQFLTPHLQSIGAIEISDQQYCMMLVEARESPACW